MDEHPFDVNYSGRKGYREFLNNWTTAMPDCKAEIVNVIGGEEWTVVEFIGRGTHTGPLVGPQGTMPATQKKLDLKCCELLRIKDGQIAEAHLYFDGRDHAAPARPSAADADAGSAGPFRAVAS